MLDFDDSPQADSAFLQGYTALKHSNELHQEYVVVNWCLSNICNLKCSYCPDDLHNGSIKWPHLSDVKTFCEKVINHYRGRKVYFEFTGGEVTLWKELPELVLFLKEKGCRVGIISNATRSEKFWTELIPKLDHVCLSYHPESGQPDHFFKIVSLCAHHIRTHVNLMMHPRLFADCLNLAYQVKDVPNISLAIQPLVVDMKEELFDYTPTQKKIIDTQNAFLAKQIKYDKHFESFRGAMSMIDNDGNEKTMSPQRFISSSNNSWKGWQCYAGVEQIVIDMSGQVMRGWCGVGGIIGRIGDENLKLPTEPILCNKDVCHCNLDIMSTKIFEQKKARKPSGICLEGK